MRIAFIVKSFPNLSETFILNQITGLIDRGHEVDIYALKRGDVSKVHEAVAEYNLLEKTRYSPQFPKNYFKRLIKAIWLMLSNFHKNPVVILDSLNVFKWGRKAACLQMLYRVIPFLKGVSYDIIHCHFGPNGVLASRLRELGAIRGKLITTFHGHDVNVLPRRHGDSYYKQLFDEAELCTVSSSFVLERVKLLGCSSDKLIRLPVGVKTFEFRPSNRQLHSGDEIIVLTVGRLVEAKGIKYSIRAIAQLLPHFPHIQYQIAGEGPLRLELERLTQKLGISDKVKFLGAQTRTGVLNLYQKAHLFLLSSVRTSKGAEEGQGLVLLEAQATGLPVLATRIGGIPESVLDGKTGFLVPERDVDALAERLGFLIEHPELWPEMGRAGREYVEANFDIDKLNDRLVEIYQELLND